MTDAAAHVRRLLEDYGDFSELGESVLIAEVHRQADEARLNAARAEWHRQQGEAEARRIRSEIAANEKRKAEEDRAAFLASAMTQAARAWDAEHAPEPAPVADVVQLRGAR